MLSNLRKLVVRSEFRRPKKTLDMNCIHHIICISCIDKQHTSDFDFGRSRRYVIQVNGSVTERLDAYLISKTIADLIVINSAAAIDLFIYDFRFERTVNSILEYLSCSSLRSFNLRIDEKPCTTRLQRNRYYAVSTKKESGVFLKNHIDGRYKTLSFKR